MAESPLKNSTAVIGIALCARLLVGSIVSLLQRLPQFAAYPLLRECADCAAIVFSLLAAILLLQRGMQLPLYVRRCEPAGSGIFFCGLFSAQLLLTLLCSVVLQLFGAAPAATELPQGAAFRVWLAARLLAAPILEEWLFRGCVLSRLLPYGDGGALLLSSLLFALSHGSIAQLLPAFASGIFLGLAALRHGMGVSIRLHMLNNALAVLLLILQQTDFAPIAQFCYIAAALFCGCYAWLHRKQFPAVSLHGCRAKAYCSAPLTAAMALMLLFMFF